MDGIKEELSACFLSGVMDKRNTHWSLMYYSS